MPQSAPGQLTRQQIYDRIRESSKDEYILEEMVRLGFWPQNQDKPTPSEALIQRQGELERELRDLMAQQRLVEDPEKALKEMRKQRMAESRRKREENKVKRIEAAHAKARAWHERRKKEILFVGAQYSGGLQDTANQSERLARHGLPDLPDALTLAEAMGISLSELRFLTFSRPTSTVNHYQRFEIIKKSGGTRLISAPMPRLKRAQYWILDNLLNKIPLPEAAHGFVAARSIVTNARPHVGAKVVINLDLKDFFPTITYARIKGMFRAQGYSGQAATLLALLCSEPDTEQVRLDDTTYFVGCGPRRLPQGAPTSPAISNILCGRLDRRLSGMAAKLGYAYTRYADDMTFSCTKSTERDQQKLLWRTRQIIAAEGFALNEAKTRIMHRGRRQEVTGIVVNDKPAVDRKTLKRFRALLFQIEKDGPRGKQWGSGGDLFEAIQGYANFIHMVDPVKGNAYLKKVKRILKIFKYRPQEVELRPLTKDRFRKKAAAGEGLTDNWWQAKERPAPEMVLPQARKGGPVETRVSDEQMAASQEERPGEAVAEKENKYLRFMKYAVGLAVIVLAYRLSPLLAVILLILLYLAKRR